MKRIAILRTLFTACLLLAPALLGPQLRADAIVVNRSMKAPTIAEITIQPVDGVWKVTDLQLLSEERL